MRFRVSLCFLAALAGPWFAIGVAEAQEWSSWRRDTRPGSDVIAEHRFRNLSYPYGTQVEYRVRNRSRHVVTVINKGETIKCSNGRGPTPGDFTWARDLEPGKTEYRPAGNQSVCAGRGYLTEMSGVLTIIIAPDPWPAFQPFVEEYGVVTRIRRRDRHNNNGTDYEFEITNTNAFPVTVKALAMGFECSDGPARLFPSYVIMAPRLGPGKTKIHALNGICKGAGAARRMPMTVTAARYVAPPEPTREEIAAKEARERDERLKAAYRITLKNGCRKDIEMAVVYRDAVSNRWSNELTKIELVRLKRKQAFVVDGSLPGYQADATGSHYFVYYQLAGGKPLLKGRKVFDIPALGGRRSFVKVTASPRKVNGERMDIQNLTCG